MSNLNYTVRRADKEDASGIGKVHYNEWLRTYTNLLPPEMLASLSEQKSIAIFKKENCKDMYVATVDGTVVAFCGYGAWRVTRDVGKPAQEKEGEIVGLYVLDEFQRNGIGKALLKHAESELMQAGYTMVSLWFLEGNTKAQAFYKAMGFHDTAEEKQTGPIHELKMTKELAVPHNIL